MRYLQIMLISLTLCPAVAASAAAPKVVWSEEAEKFATPGGMHFGTAVADDAAASGGKAVRIPYEAGSNGWSMVFSAPRMEMRGQVLFTFRLRAEDLPPLPPGLALTLVAHDKQTGQWGTKYDQAQDLARIDLKVEPTSAPVEQFTITLSTTGSKTGLLVLEWEQTKLSVPFEVK